MKTLIIADDHKIIRDGLKSLISPHSDLQVVAEAGDGRRAVELVRELRPDVVIMDVNMPELNGIDATRQIVSEIPDTRVIALSMYSDRRFVNAMLKAGASGYLLKDCAFEEIIRAIKTVLNGQMYLSATITSQVVDDLITKKAGENESTLSMLSNREREVLQLLAEGNSTKEIASTMNVSVKTIESHRKNIMDKIDLRSVAELTKFAIREGLTSLDT
ncbi:response regulator transcription factor [bacterium]|nr:response regulator transcription factor [bacterium]